MTCLLFKCFCAPMSRSKRKTPIVSHAGFTSCKAWRSQENRRYRAYANNLIRHRRYDDIQGFCGRFGNEWDSPRDGKTWYDDGKGVSCEDAAAAKVGYWCGWQLRWDHVTEHYKCDVAYKKQMRK